MKKVSLYASILLIIISCDKRQLRKNCCKEEGVTIRHETVDSFYVLFPNIFTPNGDGINDIFGPFGENFEIVSFTIEDFFSASPSNYIWDGSNDGNIITGVCDFDIEVRFPDGSIKSASGKVCSMPNTCEETPDHIMQCVFPNQFDPTSRRFNLNLSNSESFCP